MAVLFYAPRVLAILLAVFYGLFAFDTPLGVGFLVHLIPSLLIIACVAAFWKFDLAGCISFLIIDVAVTFCYSTWSSASHFLLITVPNSLICLLYLASYLAHRRKHTTTLTPTL